MPGKLDDSYDSVTRQYSYNLQPEVNELLREFRKLLDDYTNKDGLERVMMTEGRLYHLHIKLQKSYFLTICFAQLFISYKVWLKWVILKQFFALIFLRSY